MKLRPALVSLALSCLAGFSLAACVGRFSPSRSGGRPPGDYGDPNDPAAQACAAAPVDVPAAALTRLDANQYLNTERDLFQQPDLALPLATPGTSSSVITQLEVEKINDAAPQVIATGGHRRFAPCDVKGAFDDGCAGQFIRAFGLAAFRRPLAADEIDWLTGVYQNAKSLTGVTPAVSFQEAIDTVATVMIQAPQHLYLDAVGVEDPSLPSGLRRMTGYERASRLSYLLTQSTPDDTLLSAAAAGQLDSADGMRAQAERLVDSPRGHLSLRAFASKYLGLQGSATLPVLEEVPKDAAHFPLDNPALRTAMRAESEAFYEHVFYDLGGSFDKLMTATDAYVNGPLAKVYGVAGGPSSASEFKWVQLDASQRAGIFTRAAFLTEMANQEFESEIHRGVQLYKFVMCQTLGPPPANANNNVPPVAMGNLSVRKQTEARTSPSLCQGCHSQFNPIGFTFDHYDALGQWQTADKGTNSDGTAFSAPVDSSSTVPGTDIAGSYADAVALSQALAKSQQTRNCMAEQLFVQAVGRATTTQDQCTVMALRAAFKRSGGDMHALVLDAATSPPALYLRVDQ